MPETVDRDETALRPHLVRLSKALALPAVPGAGRTIDRDASEAFEAFVTYAWSVLRRTHDKWWVRALASLASVGDPLEDRRIVFDAMRNEYQYDLKAVLCAEMWAFFSSEDGLLAIAACLAGVPLDASDESIVSFLLGQQSRFKRVLMTHVGHSPAFKEEYRLKENVNRAMNRECARFVPEETPDRQVVWRIVESLPPPRSGRMDRFLLAVHGRSDGRFIPAEENRPREEELSRLSDIRLVRDPRGGWSAIQLLGDLFARLDPPFPLLRSTIHGVAAAALERERMRGA